MKRNVANDSLLILIKSKFLTTSLPYLTIDIRFQLWPYTKLMIIFWLIIPDFGRASYVYNKLSRSLKPHIVKWGLNNSWKKWFFEKDNFLMHAEIYMKENGTEALEKLIASKVNSYVV